MIPYIEIDMNSKWMWIIQDLLVTSIHISIKFEILVFSSIIEWISFPEFIHISPGLSQYFSLHIATAMGDKVCQKCFINTFHNLFSLSLLFYLVDMGNLHSICITLNYGIGTGQKKDRKKLLRTRCDEWILNFCHRAFIFHSLSSTHLECHNVHYANYVCKQTECRKRVRAHTNTHIVHTH